MPKQTTKVETTKAEPTVEGARWFLTHDLSTAHLILTLKVDGYLRSDMKSGALCGFQQEPGYWRETPVFFERRSQVCPDCLEKARAMSGLDFFDPHPIGG
jgi:hypothetical protein